MTNAANPSARVLDDPEGANGASDSPASAPIAGDRLRVCLAASGGGHVRQLLDLEPAWSQHDYFFVTEDTALGRSIAQDHPCEFVAHFALGQAKLGGPLKMALSALSNVVRSTAMVLRRRPDVVVSTGAGSVYFSLLVAKLLGAKIVVIESFARFDNLSAFARLAGPLADRKVVQSPALARLWPDAAVFDPLKILDGQRPPKRKLLFATVGATLPFDRMIEAVATLKAAGDISEEVVLQTGVGGLAPAGLQVDETLPFDQMLAHLREADIVVCHGGTGSLITALRQGCRVVAMPRLPALGEHYDNHQSEITAAFAARGLIAVANSPDELRAALETVRGREPVSATSEPTALTAWLAAQLEDWSSQKTKRRRA